MEGEHHEKEIDSLIRASEEILSLHPGFHDVRQSLGQLYYLKGQELLLLGEAGSLPAYEAWKRALELNFIIPTGDSYSTFEKLGVKHGGLDPKAMATRSIDRFLAQETSLERSERDLRAVITKAESLLALDATRQDLRIRLARWVAALAQQIYYRTWESQTPTDLDEAVSEWKRALEIVGFDPSPEWIEVAYKAVHASHWQGNQSSASWFVDRAFSMQERLTAAHPLAPTGIRFLQTRTCTHTAFGHLIGELEFFAKMKLSGWCPPFRGVFLGARDKVINIPALDRWQSYGLAVTEPRLIRRFEGLKDHLEYNSYWLKMPEGRTVHSWSGFMAAQQGWEDRGGGPLYSFSRREEAHGWGVLHELGLPKDAWYVTLIVRDHYIEANNEKIKPSSAAQRDARIDSYQSAIRRIRERGGWIIRIGDRTMPKLPSMEGIIDYAHSPLKSPMMDLFTVAKSRFLLGTASGPSTVAVPFAIPSILTNISPMNGMGIQAHDLYIPKLLFSEREGRTLTFRETFSQPFYFCVNDHKYRSVGVTHIDNTSEELEEVSLEMLDRLDGKLIYSAESEKLQAQFRSIVATVEPRAPRSRIGDAFLRRHQHLLV